jgi:hypothetical protein
MFQKKSDNVVQKFLFAFIGQSFVSGMEWQTHFWIEI